VVHSVLPAWHDQAACKAPNADPDWFYPDPLTDSINGMQAKTAMARAVCRGCPVRAECLTHALATPAGHDWGIRAGTTPGMRRQLRRRRRADWTPAMRRIVDTVLPEARMITMGDHDGRSA
jgi:WhiB family transcriptional regulator, redox-sensing transcriptional regulator